MAQTSPGETARPVDSRLLHANERTLLAWLRTGLASIALGFVLMRVDAWVLATATPEAQVLVSAGTPWIGAAFVLVGALSAGLAILRFVRTRNALRVGSELPTDVFPIAVALAVTLLGVTLAISCVRGLLDDRATPVSDRGLPPPQRPPAFSR